MLEDAIYHYCRACGAIWYEYANAYGEIEARFYCWLAQPFAGDNPAIIETAMENEKYCGCNE